MSLTITPVTTKAQLRRFIGLPATLYAGLPGFVAPLRMDRRILLDPARGAFFRTGRAQYWIAEREGRAVGRISAQIGGAQPLGVAPGAGQFGAIDALDDAEAVSALLATAEVWLRDQGCSAVFGPCLLSMNGEPGLLVAGQTEPPMIMAPWHPAYLEGHLRAAGYKAVKDLHNWRLDRAGGTQAALSDQARRTAERMQVTIRSLDMKNIGRDLAVMCDIYNDAWQDNWGFVPLTPADLSGIEREMKPYLKPETGIIVEKAGQPVAVLMILPNTFELSADLGMDPSPLGWLKLGQRTLRPRFRSGRVILMGIRSQMRQSIGGAAIAMALIDALGRRFADHDWDYVEGGWVLEDNIPLNRILETAGFRRSRTFRLFEKPLA